MDSKLVSFLIFTVITISCYATEGDKEYCNGVVEIVERKIVRYLENVEQRHKFIDDMLANMNVECTEKENCPKECLDGLKKCLLKQRDQSRRLEKMDECCSKCE
ncbi:unnamed protein product [Bursaphelenchus xylophilus]|uniref:(pine wood nematode) hypothetical protein n=1 Tax=Bursaphelenchus xylophilus TaxID=6326 RepID=A0A1I7RYV6_BURXY|nr:unnamed protein product [Bursaphelenchus xylophilus]CAG9092162.1 unnamed protein product [Bursaphelenchus xylophilus]